MNSTNTFHDCDRMIIPDFIKLDEIIQNSIKAKSDESSNLLEHLTQLIGMSNS